ncbi:MAG: hypothetical protein HOQ11_17710 [Gemmatimonadaceae bacterium]|nr:hypothetical protein [Gemmatimonadaceae bacterium]NUQ94692.1 hypothetical protein [Gemmatimonadaceae bacterium]NUS99242.1 hypothetical protein [Gemmatimonadaceae bacterium]
MLVLIALGASPMLGACADGCADRMLTESPSPDGSREAVIFERACGATTGFSTQVSVVDAGRHPTGRGNVFIADTDHGLAPAGPGGGPEVRVRWLGPHTLEVRYHPRARVFQTESRPRGLELRLVADSSVSATT